ncbi:hypothetical protein F2P45_13205 [Massilia sp. CCM 8733]|uniref:Uncharacterized protein n=1 Tax=Massilia mucilaginosa TaxID=2609282 RepID=A0ABX0NSV7_9BURK|nr:hypothetical protein [Massilia mucilaginosa]NHZ89963.1 hypothetical protein [Massilia mucilaginosa]
MRKHRELDFLAADLAAVEALLASRSEADDPIGFLQYTCRKAAIEEQLQRLSNRPDLHAEIGIFFGGGPLKNAQGINVEFAAEALNDIHDLITTAFATSAANRPADSARADFTDRSNMLLTDVVRGAMGFILEEAIDATNSTATPLRTVLTALVDTLAGIGANDAATSDEAAAALDPGLLTPLTQFFVRLDEHKATLRVVCGSQDIFLDACAVALARRRLQETEIEETGADYAGTLFLLPQSRRFELQANVDGAIVILSGIVGHEAAAQFASQHSPSTPSIDARHVSQQPRTVVINTKMVRDGNRPRRLCYLVRVGEVSAVALDSFQ